jgi:predicted aspartyl protease
MAIDFPTSPSVNDTLTVGNVIYTWDGTKWTAVAAGGGGATDKIEEGNTSAEVIDTGSDGRFVVTTEGSERLRVNSAGEIGLAGANYGTSGQVLTSGGTGAAPTWSTPAAADKISEGNTEAEVVDTGSDGHFKVTTEGTERLRVTSTGEVGIGTTSPGVTLDVVGQVRASASSTNALIVNRAATDGDIVSFSVGGTDCFVFNSVGTRNISVPGANPLGFKTNGAERARIDGDGRLLVGTNSVFSVGGLNGQNCYSVSSSASWAMALRHSAATDPFGLTIQYSGASPNDTGKEFIYCTDSTGVRFSARSNGGIANYSANNVNLSDINAKKDITPSAGTWDCLKEWEIVNFRYKDQPDDADLNLGVIAQQVAESCPEVITVFQEAKEATETEPAQEERLGVKDQQMMWMAIKALQEAQLRIEALEAEVTALKAQ